MSKMQPITKTILTLIIGIAIGSTSLVYAAPSIPALQKQITTLQNQVKTLTSENNKMRTELNKYKSIYSLGSVNVLQNGVTTNSADFITMNNRPYIALDQMLPALTNKSDENYLFNASKKELQIGVLSNNGEVSLTSLQYYKKSGDYGYLTFDKWPSKSSFMINGTRYYKGITTDDYHTASVTYKLDGKYSKIKFKVGIDDKYSGTGKKGGVRIYGDNNTVIYDSGDLLTQSDAILGEVNLTGVKFFVIEVYGDACATVLDPVLIP